uniref:Uncharacterized protein n=1 Tax=Rhizophora mucronata TaxID=61149 RepID=A0A2P2Q3H2_RHIMU
MSNPFGLENNFSLSSFNDLKDV